VLPIHYDIRDSFRNSSYFSWRFPAYFVPFGGLVWGAKSQVRGCQRLSRSFALRKALPPIALHNFLASRVSHLREGGASAAQDRRLDTGGLLKS
jgi:hypothetical protein